MTFGLVHFVKQPQQQQSMDCESLTPTQGATQQSMNCESLTPTQGATQQSVDCESLTPTQGPHNKAWIVSP